MSDGQQEGKRTWAQSKPRHVGYMHLHSIFVTHILSLAWYLHCTCSSCLPASHHLPLGECASYPTLCRSHQLHLGEFPAWAQAGGYYRPRDGKAMVRSLLALLG